MQEFYRHYRLQAFYRYGFRSLKLGYEARGGVTLCVHTRTIPEVPDDPGVLVQVGITVCSLQDNYCRKVGRKVARDRVDKTRAGGRFAYAEHGYVVKVMLEDHLEKIARDAVRAVYGSGYTALLRSGGIQKPQYLATNAG